jgi:DNA-binding NarL/FixJ family response regulator
MENCLLRDAMGKLLRRQGDMEVVGRSGPRERSTEEVEASECDVLLMDFFDSDWFSKKKYEKPEAAKRIALIAIGMSEDYDQFLSAVQGGVKGYLLREASATEVVGAVRAVFRGDAVCPAQMCARLFETVAEIKNVASPREPKTGGTLTLRQQKVMGMVATGLTNKEIASRLNLSEFTVKNHLRRIMKRMDATSRSQAVDAMLSHGYSLST